MPHVLKKSARKVGGKIRKKNNCDAENYNGAGSASYGSVKEGTIRSRRQWRVPAIVSCIVVAIVVGLFFGRDPRVNTREYFLEVATVILAGQVIEARVARSPQEQELGLGGVRRLKEDESMLFPFSTPAPQFFWNKRMLIPFDLLWIRDGRVIGIEANIPPESTAIRTVYSPGPVTHVLELSAGWTERYGVEVGDKIEVAER